MDIEAKIKKLVSDTLERLGVVSVEINLEHPAEISNGDYSTNVVLVASKKVGKKAPDLAQELIQELQKEKIEEIEKIEVAGTGFINFYLSKTFFENSVKEIIDAGKEFGKNKNLAGQKVLVEYTDPNPFKQFHIGQLMSNTIGEAISRLSIFSGAETKRANYQGDIGPHVAKAIWGMMQHEAEMPNDGDSLARKSEFLGNSYAHGATLYESDPEIKKQIDEINIHLYKKDDEELNVLYEKGRVWSLEHFEEIYKKLGTTFDYYFFESEVFEEGTRIVKEHLGRVFHESEGAVVFRGEDYGLHTRVFLTSKGVPTYEAKEIGLHKKKAETYPFDRSVIITANEQIGVFEVGLKAFEQIDPQTAKKTDHIAHGMLRLPSGKMSSRTGDVIAGESLLSDLEEKANEKVKELPHSDAEKKDIAEKVAVAAFKYTVLKQSPGKDIIFDMEKSLSFEGDSGPYLQYTLARIKSLIAKAKEHGIEVGDIMYTDTAQELFKTLYRFPKVVERAGQEYAPQLVTTFLIEIAGAFNSFYGKQQIVDLENKESSSANLGLATAVGVVLSQGFDVLGIPVLDRM